MSSAPVTSIDASSVRELDTLLRRDALRSHFQPIVDLDTGEVVAYEALVRGPAGPLATPDALFGTARAAGRLADLDAACRRSAVRSAAAWQLHAPLAVFVNVEPQALDAAALDELEALTAAAAGPLQIVLEITERAIAHRPADLLRTVERVRALGWGVALDDVGADSMSLAFMPLLRPDVVKLDLRLVQQRPSLEVAEIMNAVNAYAESTGALVLAEGIETDQHLHLARALGATLGQGWRFGRPTPEPQALVPDRPLQLPPPAAPSRGASAGLLGSPFDCLPERATIRRAPKDLLIALSKQLEREAMRLGPPCVVAAAFQEAKHFTPATERRYRELARRTSLVCALGDGLAQTPVAGVRGAVLAPHDPVRGEWDIAVISPHFAAALLARDLGEDGPDLQRTFEYAVTYDRDAVAAAARSLLARLPEHDADPEGPAPQ